MRIGLIAPPWVPVPPPAYGGTEIVVDNLARGLQNQGHEVRLFTVGESTCPVTRRYRYPKAVTAMGPRYPRPPTSWPPMTSWMTRSTSSMTTPH